MKKLLLALAIIAALITPCMAGQLSVGSVSTVSEATNVLLNYVTSAGASGAVDLGGTASGFSCEVKFSGTVPTSAIVNLEGSVSGEIYSALAAHTVTYATPSTWIFHIADKPVRYIRGNFVSKVGGDATTAVYMTCTAVQR